MAKAHIIPDAALDRLIDDIVVHGRTPERDLVIILLSCKAGLRAQEIAGLTWRCVTGVSNTITDEILIPATVAKKGHERVIPTHPLLKEALEILRAKTKGKTSERIVLDFHGEAMSPNNVAQYMRRTYHRYGLNASSHSGRRSVITKLARTANEHGCSLFDVMRIAGHKDIETTEAYVVHSDNVHTLMRSI